MIGLKRFIRPGFIFSVLVHAGLLLGLLVLGAHSVPPAPPEAMTVEIVPPSEVPELETHFEGTPLESKTSGSELVSDSDKGSADAAPPRPKTHRPSMDQAQGQAKPQRTPSKPAAQAQAQQQKSPPPEPQPPTPPDPSEILAMITPTVEPQERPKEAETPPNAGEMFAMPLALPGGKLGGGFDAPAPNPAKARHDDLAAFRAHVATCSHLPPGTTLDENVMILVRVSFNRDGTLAAPPKLLDTTLSPDAGFLMQAATDALQNCQPYPELPADKYKKWKSMDLVVTPFSFGND